MLAFFGPIQIGVVMIVVLVVFGPEKMPELGQQLGRALRDMMKMRQQFMDAINLDEKPEPTYEPPRYDNLDNTYASTKTAEIPGESYNNGYNGASGWQAALPSYEPPKGDFASSALSDTGEDYNVSSAPKPAAPAPESLMKPADGAIPRSKNNG